MLHWGVNVPHISRLYISPADARLQQFFFSGRVLKMSRFSVSTSSGFLIFVLFFFLKYTWHTGNSADDASDRDFDGWWKENIKNLKQAPWNQSEVWVLNLLFAPLMQPNPDPSWLSKNQIYFRYVRVKINCQRDRPARPRTSRCETQTWCSSSISLQYMSHTWLNVGTSPPPAKSKTEATADKITAKTDHPWLWAPPCCSFLSSGAWGRSSSPLRFTSSSISLHPDPSIIVTLRQGSTRQPEDLLLEIEPQTKWLFLSPAPNSSPVKEPFHQQKPDSLSVC